MLQRMYNWTMSLARTRHAERALAGISFAESSFFPIPPDALMIPMVLAHRQKWFRYAMVGTVASVLGGLAGYLIGALLFEAIGEPILAFYGYLDRFEAFQDSFNEWGALVILAFGGLTPLPYKVITIGSGISGMSIPVFIAASIVARGTRFLLVAWLLHKFGDPIRVFIERNLTLLFSLFTALIILGFIAVKYIV